MPEPESRWLGPDECVVVRVGVTTGAAGVTGAAAVVVAAGVTAALEAAGVTVAGVAGRARCGRGRRLSAGVAGGANAAASLESVVVAGAVAVPAVVFGVAARAGDG